MIKLYKWLYKNQIILIKEIENITKIKTFESIITIGEVPDALGLFRPDAVILDGIPIDRIILNDGIFFKSDNKHILKILGHEILHSIEKITDKMEGDHPPKFRKWESELNTWIDKHTFRPMPEISFDRGSYWVRAKGISKHKTYQCNCKTMIYNMEELDIFCQKCNSKFYLIDDGLEDFNDARRSRASPLIHTARRLELATNKQIRRFSPFGLDRKLLEICNKPNSAREVKKELITNREVKTLLKKLYRAAINLSALKGVSIENKHLERVCYILDG